MCIFAAGVNNGAGDAQGPEHLVIPVGNCSGREDVMAYPNCLFLVLRFMISVFLFDTL